MQRRSQQHLHSHGICIIVASEEVGEDAVDWSDMDTDRLNSNVVEDVIAMFFPNF